MVLMLKAEKCKSEKYNFSTPWSMEGAPPFAKPVNPVSLFVIALYQLLLFKDARKDGMCLKGLLFQNSCKMGFAKFKVVWFVSESVDNLTGRLLGVKLCI